MSYREQTLTASGLNVIMGIWLILAPYVLGVGGTGTGMTTNFTTLGIIIGILALIRIFTPATTRWLSWVNLVLGLWLIISPFVVGYTSPLALWNSIIVGIIVAALAAWSSSSASHMLAR